VGGPQREAPPHRGQALPHPVVGQLTLDFESLDLPGDPGQKVLVYSAEPGSPSRQALDLLASWASTPEAATSTCPSDFEGPSARVQVHRTTPRRVLAARLGSHGAPRGFGAADLRRSGRGDNHQRHVVEDQRRRQAVPLFTSLGGAGVLRSVPRTGILQLALLAHAAVDDPGQGRARRRPRRERSCRHGRSSRVEPGPRSTEAVGSTRIDCPRRGSTPHTRRLPC
jgi:hypothetical protein